jgi:hypothetical protein
MVVKYHLKIKINTMVVAHHKDLNFDENGGAMCDEPIQFNKEKEQQRTNQFNGRENKSAMGCASDEPIQFNKEKEQQRTTHFNSMA